jgi:hypothetical protein
VRIDRKDILSAFSLTAQVLVFGESRGENKTGL